MKCKNCNEKDAIKYSQYSNGEFCSRQCARSFSTRNKRQEINEKVSKSLYGRTAWNNSSFKKGYDARRHIFTKNEILKGTKIRWERQKLMIDTLPFHELGRRMQRSRILNEQENKCDICKNTEWMERPINLDLHHKDGNKQNNKRENLQLICPNCHSYTKTWCGRNINGNGRNNMVSDNEFKTALVETDNIRQALIKLGLTAYK